MWLWRSKMVPHFYCARKSFTSANKGDCQWEKPATVNWSICQTDYCARRSLIFWVYLLSLLIEPDRTMPVCYYPPVIRIHSGCCLAEITPVSHQMFSHSGVIRPICFCDVDLWSMVETAACWAAMLKRLVLLFLGFVPWYACKCCHTCGGGWASGCSVVHSN